MKPVRIGLLGASRIAPKAVIAPARARGDAIVTVVAARDVARARAFADTHGIASVAATYAELVARDDVDVVYCALPPAWHVEPCLQALAAGKALLVEKPFGLNADDARRIVAEADRADRPALEAFHYRFHSMFVEAIRLVRDGAIGDLRRADGVFEAEIARRDGELRWNAALGGGGTMDLGCYVLHALRTVFDTEPEVRSAEAQMIDGVDAVMKASLAFPGGATASSLSSMLGPRRDWIELEGTEGMLRLERFVAPQQGGRLVLTTRSGVRETPASGPASYDAQLEHVVQVLRGETRPLTGGQDAIANMALIDAVRGQAIQRPAKGP